MMQGADAAEQMVRLSLEGMEVAVRISGAGAKNLAALLAAVMREEQKTLGKTRLTSLIRSGRELTVFTIQEKDLQVFRKEAKRYGVLYCDIKEKDGAEGGTVDIIARAEDAPKINRIIERFQLAAVRDEKSRKPKPQPDRKRPSVRESLRAQRDPFRRF